MKGLIIVLALILIAGGGFYLLRARSNPNGNIIQNIQNIVNPGSTGQPTGGTTSQGNQITLNVASPQDGATVSDANISVSGKTLPGADVFVNETELTADANGNFSTQLTLDEGENTISVSANDNSGNSAEQELTVTYTVPNQ